MHKAHLVEPWGLLVSTIVMLDPLEKTFTLLVEEKAGLSKPQLWIARCFGDKPLWVASKCTLSPQGVKENHLVERLLFPFRGALVNERWLWENMRFSDTEHTIKVIRLLSYLLYFTPASSHDDNILDRWCIWGQEAAGSTKYYCIMGFVGALDILGYRDLIISEFSHTFFPVVEMHSPHQQGEHSRTSVLESCAILARFSTAPRK